MEEMDVDKPPSKEASQNTLLSWLMKEDTGLTISPNDNEHHSSEDHTLSDASSMNCEAVNDLTVTRMKTTPSSMVEEVENLTNDAGLMISPIDNGSEQHYSGLQRVPDVAVGGSGAGAELNAVSSAQLEQGREITQMRPVSSMDVDDAVGMTELGKASSVDSQPVHDLSNNVNSASKTTVSCRDNHKAAGDLSNHTDGSAGKTLPNMDQEEVASLTNNTEDHTLNNVSIMNCDEVKDLTGARIKTAPSSMGEEVGDLTGSVKQTTPSSMGEEVGGFTVSVIQTTPSGVGEEVEDLTNKTSGASEKYIQTVLTWSPHFDVYSLPGTTKEDRDNYQMMFILEELCPNEFGKNCQKLQSNQLCGDKYRNYQTETLHVLSALCSTQTVPDLVQHPCAVIEFVYNVLEDELITDRALLMACATFLEAVIPHDKKVCETVMDTRQAIHRRLCLLFDSSVRFGEKCVLISLFRHMVKQALTIDDDVFERMLHRGCSLVETRNEDLLLATMLFLDAAVELYQEWEVHTLLLKFGSIPAIVSCCNHPHKEIALKSLRIVGNLLSLVHLNINWAAIKAGIMNQLVGLLLQEDTELLQPTLWVLSNVAAGPKGSLKALFHYGVIPLVLHHLRSECGAVANEALYVIANLIEDSTAKQRTVIIKDTDILAAFIYCLKAEKSCLQSEETEGVLYLELLKDTWETIHKCLKPREEDEEFKSPPSDTDSEYSNTNDSDDDDSDSKRLHYLDESEKEAILAYLQEQELTACLGSLTKRGWPDSAKGVLDALEVVRAQFKTLFQAKGDPS